MDLPAPSLISMDRFLGRRELYTVGMATPVQAKEDLLTIKEMAALCRLHESTLRYYEKVGLLAPAMRDESSGHRRYYREEADSIAVIASLRACGLSIQDMKAVEMYRKQGKRGMSLLIELLQSNREKLQSEINRLQYCAKILDAAGTYSKDVKKYGREHAKSLKPSILSGHAIFASVDT